MITDETWFWLVLWGVLGFLGILAALSINQEYNTYHR